MKSQVKLSQKEKKTFIFLLFILAIVLVIVLVKHFENRKVMKEMYARAYEALKAPEGEMKQYTEAELYQKAYEALKAPEENNN